MAGGVLPGRLGGQMPAGMVLSPLGRASTKSISGNIYLFGDLVAEAGVVCVMNTVPAARTATAGSRWTKCWGLRWPGWRDEVLFAGVTLLTSVIALGGNLLAARVVDPTDMGIIQRLMLVQNYLVLLQLGV